MTWPDFVARVNAVIDALEIAPDAVDVDGIHIIGSDDLLHVDVSKRTDGRFDLIVE